MQEYFKEISRYRSGIMGLSIISIMMFHQYFFKNPLVNIFHNYGFWGVDVFLFISGMGLVHSLESNSLFIFYKRRFIRIEPACIICGISKIVAFAALGNSVAVLRSGLNLGWWSIFGLDLWFINTIVILYLLSPFIYKCLLDFPRITLISVLFVFVVSGLVFRGEVGYDWRSVVGVFAWTVERLPVFMLGMLMSIHKGILAKRCVYYSYISLFGAFCLVVVRKYWVFYLPEMDVILYFLLSIGMIALVKMNILILKLIPIRLKFVVDFWGNLSLELYLVHEFIYNVIKLRLNINCYMQFVVSIIMSVLFAYLCKRFVDMVKIILYDKKSVDA